MKNTGDVKEYLDKISDLIRETGNKMQDEFLYQETSVGFLFWRRNNGGDMRIFFNDGSLSIDKPFIETPLQIRKQYYPCLPLLYEAARKAATPSEEEVDQLLHVAAQLDILMKDKK